MQKIRFFNWKTILSVGAVSLLLHGCGGSLHSNEGTIRMGRSIPSTHGKPPGVNVLTSVFASDATDDTIIKGGKSKKSDNDEKNDDDKKTGNAISIRLISAYICDFRESAGPVETWERSNEGAVPCNGGDGNASIVGDHRNRTRGEIAIIVNAGERTDKFPGLSFDPSDIKRSGRVVYYNEDVRESGQLINALNIPIYGPRTYTGKPFFLDVSILELDNPSNSQSRQLLQQLANVGGTAYPAGTPILKLLNTLGGALLSANTDDLEFRYQMEFDPSFTCGDPCKKTAIYRASLREGYYALIRKERRDQPMIDMSALEVSPADGIVINKKRNADGSISPYMGSTWLLFRIAKEDPANATEQDAGAATAQFLERLEQDRVKTIDDFVKAVSSKQK